MAKLVSPCSIIQGIDNCANAEAADDAAIDRICQIFNLGFSDNLEHFLVADIDTNRDELRVIPIDA